MVGIGRISALLWLTASGTTLGQSPTTFASKIDASWAAPVSLLNRPARLQIAFVPLNAGLDTLAKRSGVPLAFSPSMLPEARLVSCACETLNVGQALDEMLQGTWFAYRELDHEVIVEPAQRRSNYTVSDLTSWGVRQDLRDDLNSHLGLRSSALSIGPVAGVVVDAHSNPIAGAIVAIPGTRLTTRTDAQGRFRIEGVTGTEVSLQITTIGYRPLSQVIKVGDTEARLIMTEAAVNLDVIVVTGTPGGTERRAVVNSVSEIDARQLTKLIQTAPAPDVSKLIDGRAPGVLVQPATGTVGGGGRISMRGLGSLSLGTEPLIYVDGVRMDNRIATGPGTGSTANGPGIWPSMSRLNDISPEDMQSLEVIKGPAAATLYGTEASNGVVQIITRHGTPGPAKWDVGVTEGVNWLMKPENMWRQIYRTRADGSIYHFNLVQTENARGTPIFRNAPLQRYNANVSGGSNDVQYYLGGTYANEMGVLAPNQLKRFSGAANLQGLLSQKVHFNTSIHYSTGRTNVGQESVTSGNETIGSLDNPYRFVDPATDRARGFNVAPPEDWIAAFHNYQDLNRFTASMQLRHDPTSWFSQTLTIGRDAVYENNTALNGQLTGNLAIDFPTVAGGRVDISSISSLKTNGDYSGSLTAHLSGSLSSRSSVGAQLYRTEVTTLTEHGEGFPAAGLQTVTAATTRDATQDYLRNTTVGFFIQQQFEWKHRLFLNAGIRADDNSSFGSRFKAAWYPKGGIAWVISEEPFWHSVPLVNTLRLRAAYGQSGLQPSAFSALQTYGAISGPGNVPAVRPLSAGNPNLGPERGAELEFGFEAGLLNERASIDLTYYDKRTHDVILTRPTPPSGGFPNAQVINLGEITNHGLEMQMRGSVIRNGPVEWDLGVNLSTNNGRVADLGGTPFISAGANQYDVVGFPVAAFFEKLVISGQVVNGKVTNIMCDGGGGTDYTRPSGNPVPCATAPRVYLGKPTPDLQAAFSTDVTVFRRLKLYGLVNMKLGSTVFDASTYFACLSSLQCEINYYPDKDPLKAALYALPGIFGRSVTPPNRNFVRIQQVSATYTLPERWLRGLRITSAQITVSARNLHTFKGSYEGTDPDIVTQTGTQYYINFHQLPSPTQLLTSVRLTF